MIKTIRDRDVRTPLAPSPPVEQVLVTFRSEWVKSISVLTEGLPGVLEENLQSVFFMPRPLAEEDESVVQLIPYVVIFKGNEVLFYQRAKRGQGDKRLAGKWSFGFGGHLNPEDCGGDTPHPVIPYEDVKDFRALYWAGLRRELFEEVDFSSLHYECPPEVALVHDETNPVGRVHLGLVHFLRLPAWASVGIKEKENLLEAQFVPLTEIGRFIAEREVETWTRLIAERMLV